MATMAFLTTMVLMSSAVLAAQIDVEVDTHAVLPGDSIMVTGAITDDDGNAGEFDYRVAAVVPAKRNGGDRIIICDSERQTTGTDGAVSFECEIPTIDELEALGVENAADRSVIPLRGGIVTKDPVTDEVTKKHGRAIIVNKDILQDKLEAILERIDNFIAHAEEAIAKCDAIIERAEAAGAETAIDRCGAFQEKMQGQIDKALDAQERVNNAISNLDDLGDVSFDEIRDSFRGFREGAGEFKSDVRELRQFAVDSRSDLREKVRGEISDRAKARAAEVRANIAEKRDAAMDRAKNIRDVRAERISGIKPVAVDAVTDVASTDADAAGTSDETDATDDSDETDGTDADSTTDGA